MCHLAAALYGLARLENRPALGEIVLYEIFEKVRGSLAWLVSGARNFAQEIYLKYQAKKFDESVYKIWRPSWYETPTVTADEYEYPCLEDLLSPVTRKLPVPWNWSTLGS